MHVISRKRLREFWERHPKAESSLGRWHKVASKAYWRNLADVRTTFPHADLVKVAGGTTLVVFNVGGNDYRLAARVLFEYGRVYIRKVMTHAEYSREHWKEVL